MQVFKCVPPEDTQVVNVKTPAHSGKKALRPPTASMAPWMQTLPNVHLSAGSSHLVSFLICCIFNLTMSALETDWNPMTLRPQGKKRWDSPCTSLAVSPFSVNGQCGSNGAGVPSSWAGWPLCTLCSFLLRDCTGKSIFHPDERGWGQNAEAIY